MNVEIAVLVICVTQITYLLLYYLHDCTFKASESLKLTITHYGELYLVNIS